MTQREISDIPANTLALIPPEMARALKVLPYLLESDCLRVLTANEQIEQVKSDLAFVTGYRILTEVVPQEEIDTAIARFYGAPSKVAGANAENDRKEPGAGNSIEDDSIGEHPPRISSDSSAVSTASRMISDAIRLGASDIHVEPYEKFLRIRFRLDGVLKEVARQSLDTSRALISRLKILADLDIAEKRRPQDGRIRVKEESRIVDIRVSSLPTDFGEKIVLRILDKSQLKLDLSVLGFDEAELRSFQRTIRLPYGMILVTGPTGSGKTTTLYAALSSINAPGINITTIEDPIEYNLAGINQTQVRADIGLTFAAILRSILRQDPNVIMVGEIRDGETAQIAIRAALTGHLVFSTLHTNDAPSALTRLIDMGVEPFLVASSVRMILAQRLLRRVCPDCSKPHEPHPEEREQLQLPAIDAATFRKGNGCRTCNNTGYKGRRAVYELLEVSNGLAEKIARGGAVSEIRSAAREHGMRTLREAALASARQGQTSVDEVLRETLM
ncbi:MAG TPA: GspE/PulE family protein [Desulfomonilaceae bacterium]|nr:GspE/PulE family protein [Desulfomonilaceae bacterium]